MAQRKIVPIVEGDGDEAAVPVLIGRWLNQRQRFDIAIARPRNAHGRDNLTKKDGIEKFLDLARREPGCAGILVLLDADEDCVKDLAIGIASRARAVYLPVPAVIICAKCEYETWFLASLETIAGKVGLKEGLSYEKPVEDLRGVKRWLTKHMIAGRAYKEKEHQPAMTQLLDFNLVRSRSHSFKYLEYALEELVKAIDNDQSELVTQTTND